jgi:S1-C subfamily serine protease
MTRMLSSLLIVFAAFWAVHAQAPAGKAFGFGAFGEGAQVVWTDSTASEIGRTAERAPWKPAVNPERRRGADVYAKVAPAVVVVRTTSGHGTGFVVDPAGLVLTNHHVVANSLEHDVARGASYASVHLGRLGRDGGMVVQDQALRAFLLKLDPSVDLALLRIDAVPKELAPLTALKFAAAPPRPGTPATIIGHPAAGMLWTMRSGEVSSTGSMPGDMVDMVMRQLSAAPQQRQEAAARLKQGPSRRIILTSTGANPGDSGGPVVDAAGNVIAVTFAVPAEPALAKFSYHIHLDEVRQFMAKVPTAPILDMADPWQLGPRVDLQDLDGDRRPDVLLAGTQEPEQILFDLDNDTPPAAIQDQSALVRGRKWDFEFALRLAADESTSSAFYDTNNDGTVDLIHTVQDDNHKVNTLFTRTPEGRWKVERNAAVAFPTPSLIQNPKLAQRLAALLKRPRPQ